MTTKTPTLPTGLAPQGELSAVIPVGRLYKNVQDVTVEAAAVLAFVQFLIQSLPAMEDAVRGVYDEFAKVRGLSSENIDQVQPAVPDRHEGVDIEIDRELAERFPVEPPNEKKP